MAYYAAVLSLKKTIHRLQHSSQFSILPSSRELLEFACEKVVSLQEVLGRLESSKSEMVESLREEIRDAAYKLEDAVEFHVSDLFLSQSESHGDEGSNPLILSPDLDGILKQEIHYFADVVKKMKKACSKQLDLELSNPFPEEEDVDVSRMDLGGKDQLKMIGLSKEFQHIKHKMLSESFLGRVVSISGMAGIGKTTFARNIFQDQEVSKHFKHCMWVTIGPKCQHRKVMLRILDQLDLDVDNIQKEGYEKLAKYLHRSLENRRYLIVLDDVWNKVDWDELNKYLPPGNRSRVLLITRLQHIARKIGTLGTCEMRFLNDEESWCLLRDKVFGKESCPLQLEEAGKKIAKNCDGLPLLIVTVADLLSKVEKTLEYWNKVAEEKDMSIFREANHKISNILLRSYKYLPQDLKAFFLYMGVFPSKCKIRASKLHNLWIAEVLPRSRYYDRGCLDMLVSSNLVLAHEKASIGGIKTCGLHVSFWHACVIQSWKEKFLHVISSFADTFKEGAKSRRRLCTYNNVLFGIKEVYNSVQSISSARLLICSGQYHPYPVPICFGLSLLKVLDVLSIRFYKFPIEVLKLIHLRYLALTYNGKVPGSISKLWNLEYLIVCRHLNIKFPGDWSYLPVEIWNMQKLRHLQVMGSCLPYLCDALLPGLLKISYMSAHSCTKEILKRIPNLQKLGIQIELMPDATEPLSCFDHLSHLHELQSLKCVIVNPNPATPQLVAPPACISSFPSNLRKLSLSGFGYPWEYMHIIAKLPILKVLKLRSYAFRGPEWIVHKDDFKMLRVLLLEDIDLVYLRSDGPCLPELYALIIKHCYKLKEIPLELGVLHRKEIIDSPLVASYVRGNRQHSVSRPRIHSSWDDEKHKTQLLSASKGDVEVGSTEKERVFRNENENVNLPLKIGKFMFVAMCIKKFVSGLFYK